MLYQLILAHFIADYPLQPNRLVQAKQSLSGLALHVSIHFMVMMIISGKAMMVVWPYLLLLTLIHFGIDFGKVKLSQYKPTWVTIPYLVDQLFHLLSILQISMWIDQNSEITNLLPISRTWAIYAIGYLLVSYVWFITERIISYQNKLYQKEMITQLWPRLIARLVLLTIFLLISNNSNLPLLMVMVAFQFQYPYYRSQYRCQIILTDLTVSSIAWGFITYQV